MDTNEIMVIVGIVWAVGILPSIFIMSAVLRNHQDAYALSFVWPIGLFLVLPALAIIFGVWFLASASHNLGVAARRNLDKKFS